MNILDSQKAISRVNVPAGTVLICQGTKERACIVIYSGIVEILSCEKIPEETDFDEILRNSLRVGFVKGETILGFPAVQKEGEVNPFSFRTLTNCVLSLRPMDSDTLTKKMCTDTSFALKIHRSLAVHAETCFSLFRNDRYLWHKVASIADSLALARSGAAKANAPEKASRENSSLDEYTAFLKSRLKAAGLPAPERWDYSLFQGQLQDKLDLYTDRDAERVESFIDTNQYAFIKRLLNKEDSVVSALLSNDGPLNRYILDFLGETITAMMRANEKILRDILSLLNRLYEKNGWVDSVVISGRNGGLEAENFFHFLAKFSLRFRKDAINLLGSDPLKTYSVFASLGRFREFKESQDVIEVSENAPAASGRLPKYKGLLGKILDFAEASQEFRNEFASLLDDAAEKKDVRSVSRIGEMYWELYERCFLKTVGTDLKSFIPGIMLHMGLVDERLVSQEALLAVDAAYASALYTDESIPVMTFPYFLEKIYKGEVQPSVTEMGDTFDYILKAQSKLTPKEKAAAFLYEDNHDDRVRFELRQVASDLGGMLFGNRKKSLPFLTDELITGDLGRLFIDPERIVKEVGKYKSRDYSMFYRQVILRHGLGTDFIQSEVIPNFVLYPCFGSRAVMWQEMDGTKKKTPGRIFMPIFFSEKFAEALLEQIAYFRWELQKTIAGHNWTDPVEGGLVGAYYDYIAFYQKNPDISPEAKQRLAEFIKRTKSEKDRFAKDYGTWLEFEYFGRMRMNPAARDVFYRFCPFPADIREEMTKKPAFSAMAARFENRRNKEKTKIDAKLRGYEKKSGTIPEELESYLRFLEM